MAFDKDMLQAVMGESIMIRLKQGMDPAGAPIWHVIENYVDPSDHGLIENYLLKKRTNQIGRIFDEEYFDQFSDCISFARGIDAAISYAKKNMVNEYEVIKWFIVETDSPSPFCTLLENQYFIGLPDSLLSMMFTFSSNMVRHIYPSLWQGHFNEKIEGNFPNHRQDAIKAMLIPNAKIWDLSNFETKSVMFYLAEISLDYMVFHEMAHIINGHFGFLAALQPSENEIEQKSRSVTRRTLEFDADILAEQLLFRYLSSKKSNMVLVKNSESVNTTALLCSYMALTVLDGFSQSRSPEDLPRMSHPPAIYRAMYAFGGLYAYIEREVNHDRALPMLTSKQYISIMNSFENAIKTIGGGTHDFENYIEWYEYFDLDRKVLMARWSTILPLLNRVKLNKYKLAPVYEPPDNASFF